MFENSLSWYSYGIIEKLPREYREFPYTLDPAFPNVNIQHGHWPLVFRSDGVVHVHPHPHPHVYMHTVRQAALLSAILLIAHHMHPSWVQTGLWPRQKQARSYFEARVPKARDMGRTISCQESSEDHVNSMPLELYLVEDRPEILNIDIPAIMWEFHSLQVKIRGTLGMFTFVCVILSHLISFPSILWIRRPTTNTNLLICESGAIGFIFPSAWIFALFSSTLPWKWSRLLWKGVLNSNDDSHQHSLWDLGGSPHPSRMLTPSFQSAAVSGGDGGAAASGPGCSFGRRDIEIGS